jgi:ABC-type cobalamin/Fe3+-siderophores transport system ATPase subunit
MTKSDSKANTTTTPSMSSSTVTTNKTTPKDAQIVTAILKDMGIVDFEPRIVHQMIEFTYS